MASVTSLGSGGTLASLAVGQFGLMRHERFDGPSLILRLSDGGTAALFARHPESGALGPYAINADPSSWGEQELIKLENVAIRCDEKTARVESSGLSYEDDSRRGSIYTFDGCSAFFLYSFNIGVSRSFWSFNGERIENPPTIAARYYRWTLEWFPRPHDPQPLFSWPPQKA